MPFNDFVYRHWVPKKQPILNFPFSFAKRVVEKTDTDLTIEFVIAAKSSEQAKKQFNEELRNALINSYDFLNRNKKKYTVKVDSYKIEDNKRKFAGSKYLEITIDDSEYTFILIQSIEQLKEVLSKDIRKMAFDTETSGLNPEEDNIVGVSFSMGNKTGYYMAIAHDEQFAQYNLGLEALKVFYEAMTQSDVVYMFNSRFDMRMMEYTDDYFDMSKVKTIDAQVNAWFSDPDFRKHNLKYLEKHFLGYYRPDLGDTLKSSKIDSFDVSLINPANILFYAAQDALSTFDLGEETKHYMSEFKTSGSIDQTLLYPLMRMENYSMRIDTKYLKEQLDYIMPRLQELNDKIHAAVGNVNMNSPKQKISLFESVGLNTGVKTKTGNMATGSKEVEDMIEKLRNAGKEYPEWVEYLSERAKLEKMQSTYFNSLLEQAKMSQGRVRLNYRNVQVATGRMSSGASVGK